MPQEEQRYRINVTVQPYEDLKSILGWIIIIFLVLVAVVAYAIYLLWPVIVATLVAALAVIIVRAVIKATTPEEHGTVCRKCGREGDPTHHPASNTLSCTRCGYDVWRWGCLNCGSWNDSEMVWGT